MLNSRNILTITLEDLVEELSQRKARHPKATRVVIAGRREQTRRVLDAIAEGVVVEQRWRTIGSERLVTNEGVWVQLASSSSGALRGLSADLVVLLGDERTVEAQLPDAALVVLVRQGRVVLL